MDVSCEVCWGQINNSPLRLILVADQYSSSGHMGQLRWARMQVSRELQSPQRYLESLPFLEC